MEANNYLTPFYYTEILSKNVRHISVPYYESLSIQKIQEFCQQHPNAIDSYLPIPRELHKISREWIYNVVATILGETFTDWVKDQIDDRNEEVKDKRKLDIELDADVAAAFRASTAVSRKY